MNVCRISPRQIWPFAANSLSAVYFLLILGSFQNTNRSCLLNRFVIYNLDHTLLDDSCFAGKLDFFHAWHSCFSSLPGRTVQYSRGRHVPGWFASCQYTHGQEKTTSSAGQLLLLFVPVQLVFASTDDGVHLITTTVFFVCFGVFWRLVRDVPHLHPKTAGIGCGTAATPSEG